MRIVMGIIWFIVLQCAFIFIGAATITYNQRSMGVPCDTTGMPNELEVFAFIAALVLAVWGTMSGKLPGTKKK